MNMLPTKDEGDHTKRDKDGSMKKLKIAIITTTFFPQIGGAEYQIKWFAEELAKRDHEVYLFTPYDAEEFIDVGENGFPKNIALRKRDADIPSDAFRMFYIFAKWVRKIKPDVVHAHFAFSSGFLAVITKLIHKAPVVITSHEDDILVIKEKGYRYGMGLKLHRRLLVNLSLKLCDANVVVSSPMKKYAIESGSSEKKLHVIPNMYVPPITEIEDEFIESTKDKYAIPRNKKILLSVSRLHQQKGLKYLIESVKNVINYDENVHLVIVGVGEEEGRLKATVEKNNLEKFVTFTGFVDEMEKHALIKGCDVFCMPSLNEAFGISLFDPMYYGKSIVASNDEGIREALGDAGLTVPKKDPVSLSEAIIKTLKDEDLRGNLSEKGKERYKLFMPDRAIGSYLKIYKELLGR